MSADAEERDGYPDLVQTDGYELRLSAQLLGHASASTSDEWLHRVGVSGHSPDKPSILVSKFFTAGDPGLVLLPTGGFEQLPFRQREAQ